LICVLAPFKITSIARLSIPQARSATMIFEGDRDEHDAPKLTEFSRQADALAQEVERMEESARKRALKRSITTIRAIVNGAHATHRPPRFGVSNHHE
jgi:hypothetical protein